MHHPMAVQAVYDKVGNNVFEQYPAMGLQRNAQRQEQSPASHGASLEGFAC